MAWANILNAASPEGVTYREVLLRWLLTRAIVDQGSDIDGVEMWHRGLVDNAYQVGIRFLHDPALLLSRYEEFLSIAAAERDRVKSARMSIWAAGGKNRHAKSYNVFNVDGQRAFQSHAHGFIAGRMLPGLFSALAISGGLTNLVFGRASKETPREMARRIREDTTTGLGACIGDKACDLFAKWAVGTFDLGAGLTIPWSRADCPLPMDQRVGRVLMRCGFMDEFFGVMHVMSVKQQGFTPPIGALRPKQTDPLPSGAWHLTVKNFRRHSKVTDPAKVEWLSAVNRAAGMPRVSKWLPQDVLSTVCHAHNAAKSVVVTPVELDDFLMGLATGCTDATPICSKCAISAGCQANNDIIMVGLKQFKT
jgi:hypothetical protein